MRGLPKFFKHDLWFDPVQGCQNVGISRRQRRKVFVGEHFLIVTYSRRFQNIHDMSECEKILS